MKASDQGLVERLSFRFLITGEEDDEHNDDDHTETSWCVILPITDKKYDAVKGTVKPTPCNSSG